MHHQSINTTNNNNNNNKPSLNMKLNNRQHHQNHHSHHTNNSNISSSHNHTQLITSINSTQKTNHLFSKKQHHHHHNKPDHNQEQIKFFTQKSKKHKSKRLKSKLKQANSSTPNTFNTIGHRHTGKNIFSNFLNQYNEDFSEQQKYFKLPILTSIELVNNNDAKSSQTDFTASYNKENLLFKDYVLIPSMTKYKHLLHTVFQEAQLENKSNYNIVEAYLKIQNWMPISLDSISSIMQCSLSSSKKLLPSPKQLSKYESCRQDTVKQPDTTEKSDSINLTNINQDNADKICNTNTNKENSEIQLNLDNAKEYESGQKVNSDQSTSEKLNNNGCINSNIDDNNNNINGDKISEKTILNEINHNNSESPVIGTTQTLNIIDIDNSSTVRSNRKVSRNESLNSSRSSSSSSNSSGSTSNNSRSGNNSMTRSNSQDSSISDSSNKDLKKNRNFIGFKNLNDKKLNESCSSRASSPQNSVSSFSTNEENEMGFTLRKSRVNPQLKQKNLTVYDMLSQIVGFSTLSIRVISKNSNNNTEMEDQIEIKKEKKIKQSHTISNQDELSPLKQHNHNPQQQQQQLLLQSYLMQALQQQQSSLSGLNVNNSDSKQLTSSISSVTQATLAPPPPPPPLPPPARPLSPQSLSKHRLSNSPSFSSNSKSCLVDDINKKNSNESNNNNLTSNLVALFSNPAQLSNLLPLLNLPMISQLLNGSSKQQHPPSNLNSPLNLTTTNSLKSFRLNQTQNNNNNTANTDAKKVNDLIAELLMSTAGSTTSSNTNPHFNMNMMMLPHCSTSNSQQPLNLSKNLNKTLSGLLTAAQAISNSTSTSSSSNSSPSSSSSSSSSSPPPNLLQPYLNQTTDDHHHSHKNSSLTVNTSNNSNNNNMSQGTSSIQHQNLSITEASPSPSASSTSSSSVSHHSLTNSKKYNNNHHQLISQNHQMLGMNSKLKANKDLILSNILSEASNNNNSKFVKTPNIINNQLLGSNKIGSSSISLNPVISGISSNADKLNNAITNSSNNSRRQRERTTFDPQEEITRLMQIFKRTHHPTRYQIASICDSLNSLACRKDKKPLEPYNIQYWFKNARAALRRKVKVEKEDGDDEDQNSGANENGVDLESILGGTFYSGHDQMSRAKFFKKDSESNNNADEFDMDEGGNNGGEGYDDSNCDEDDELDEEELDEVRAERENYGGEELILDNDYFNENSKDNLNNSQINEKDGRCGSVGESSGITNHLVKSKLNNNSNGEHENDTKKNNSIRNSSNRSRSNSNVNHTYLNESENQNKPLVFHNTNNNHDLYDNFNQEDDNSCQNELEQNRFISNNTSYASTIKNEINLTSISNKLPVKHVNNSSSSSNSHHNHNSSNSLNNRRNRVFIDPISEVPILEHYFSIETYPDHYLIEKICENLNRGEYRYKFPKLESRNIQLWFKNHRAKLKRLKSTPSITTNNQSSGMHAISTTSNTNNNPSLINMNRKGNGQPSYHFNTKSPLLNQNENDNNDDDEEEYGDYEIDDYESNQEEDERDTPKNTQASNNSKTNNNESMHVSLT